MSEPCAVCCGSGEVDLIDRRVEACPACVSRELHQKIAALKAKLAVLTGLCREYVDALDSGYDVLASHATDKIREAINPPQQGKP